MKAQRTTHYGRPGNNASRRGFSLTEVSIVLGVVMVVLSSVWAIASAVRKDAQCEQFSEQLTEVVQNVRGAYSGMALFPSTLVSTAMPTLVKMGVFPGDATRVVSGVTVVDAPYGTFTNPLPSASASPYNSLYVCGWQARGSTHCDFTGGTTNVPLFAVEVLMPSDDRCIKAVMQNSSPATRPGLVEVAINGTKMLYSGNTLPVPLSAAKQYCTPYASSTSDAVVVDFVFRLVPQQ